MKKIELDINKISYHYLQQNLTTKEIGKLYGCSNNVIIRYLKQNGIQLRSRKDYCKRIYNLNEKIFDSITEESSYLLGYFAADASMNKNRRHLCIMIQERDGELLENIRKLLSSNAPIKTIIYSKKKKAKRGLYINFCSQYMCSKLIKLGIIPNKTGKEKIPKIPNQYYAAYLLGLFDGDGCIYVNIKRKLFQFSIVSANKKFLQKLQRDIGFKSGNIVKTSSNIYQWRVTKQEDLYKLYHLMYSTKLPCLTRKKLKYQQFIKYYDNNNNSSVS